MRVISRKPVRKFKLIPLRRFNKVRKVIPPTVHHPPSDMDSESSSDFDFEANIIDETADSNLEKIFSPRKPRVQKSYF